LTEAKKGKYFVDGFMIRHFNIYPSNFDKENLYEEQKVFLIYLIGVIPELDQWKIHIDYNIKLEEIKKLKKIEINQTEKDLAGINGKDLKQLYKEQLLLTKKRMISELNEKFGIVEDEKEIEKVIETKPDIKDNNPAQLWEMLQGKGLVK